jgi:hypothetical protein
VQPIVPNERLVPAGQGSLSAQTPSTQFVPCHPFAIGIEVAPPAAIAPACGFVHDDAPACEAIHPNGHDLHDAAPLLFWNSPRMQGKQYGVPTSI